MLLPLGACDKSKPGTNVALADGGGGQQPGGPGADGKAPHEVERGPIEKIQIAASITGVRISVSKVEKARP